MSLVFSERPMSPPQECFDADADSNTKDHKSAEGIRPSMSRVNVQFIEEPVIFVGTKCRIFVLKKKISLDSLDFYPRGKDIS